MQAVPPPIVIYIEPTNDCNLRCVMCPRVNLKKSVGYLDFDLYTVIIDQIAAVDRSVFVALHLSGEPLLHPRIADMVAYAKSAGIEGVGFSTNATLLTPETATALVTAGLDLLTVSMDSATGHRYCSSHDELTAGIDAGVVALLAARAAAGKDRPTVKMRIIDMPAVAGMIEPFRSKWEGVADVVEVKPFLTWGGQIRVPGKEIRDEQLARRTVCANVLGQLVVQYDGEVSFCCLYMDDRGDGRAIIGDLRHESLVDILAGARRRAIVEAMFRHDWQAVPYCAGCPDWLDYLGVRERLREQALSDV